MMTAPGSGSATTATGHQTTLLQTGFGPILAVSTLLIAMETGNGAASMDKTMDSVMSTSLTTKIHLQGLIALGLNERTDEKGAFKVECMSSYH